MRNVLAFSDSLVLVFFALDGVEFKRVKSSHDLD